MKLTILTYCIIALRCCWGGPSDFTLMMKSQEEDNPTKELNGNYLIKELHGEDVSIYKLNMSFNDDTKHVSGFSGCNRFFGNFTFENNTITFDAMGSTKKLCNDKGNELEKKLFYAFEKANIVLFSKHGFSFFNGKKLLLQALKETSNDNLRIEYSASSRGSRKHIIISQNTIITENKISGKSNTKSCAPSDWERITNTLKSIDVETITELEPPSKDHQFDGAAIARLIVVKGGNTYETQAFDDGNPPQEIAELVKEILSISENIE